MPSTTTASGLIIDDMVVGEGDTAVAGKSVTVHYTGWLTWRKGQEVRFQQGSQRPFVFGLGAGQSSRAGTKACRA